MTSKAHFPVVHALFVSPQGAYPALADVDCWDEERDALLFAGTGPVVLHPPCGRWGKMAPINAKRWGAKIGDDGGLFQFALQLLRTNGGVLEHPAGSLAWAAFGLPKPTGLGWKQGPDKQLWTCEIWQSAYGCPAHKRTWLLYAGERAPFELSWLRDRSLATHQVGGGIHTGNRNKPRLDQKLTHITPPLLAAALVCLARRSRLSHAI